MSFSSDNGLKQLAESMDDFLKRAPARRRALHEQFGKMAKAEVDAAISGASVGTKGTVKRWQVARIGSKGGYAVVRARGSAEGARTGPNGPGAVTNYLEHGHKVRPASPGKRKRPRKYFYVDGRHFYKSAGAQVEPKAKEIAEEFAAELARDIGGSL